MSASTSGLVIWMVMASFLSSYPPLRAVTLPRFRLPELPLSLRLPHSAFHDRRRPGPDRLVNSFHCRGTGMLHNIRWFFLRGVLNRMANHPTPIIRKHHSVMNIPARPKFEVPSLGKFLGNQAHGVAHLIRHHPDRD